MSSPNKRLIGALVFFIWTAFIIAAFYVTQKPDFFTVIDGIANTFWVLAVWVLLTINGAVIGNFLLHRLPKINIRPVERILLSAGLGLGLLGLAGFILGVLGWTHPAVLIGIQVSMFLLFWGRKGFHAVKSDLQSFAKKWRAGMAVTPAWIKVALFATLLFAFILALAPPGEAFDALFYHLVGPERFLSGEGMQPSSVPHFWFPALPEGVFLWAQGMGSVRTTQLLHLTWAVLGILLLWNWVTDIWDEKIAQSTLVILISMPSLYLLASWAYTDFALTFYGLVVLFGVYKAFESGESDHQTGWIIIAGVAASMSMGVKYTSFLVPVSGVLLIVWWQRKNLGAAVKASLIFSLMALFIAAPWYIRSWIVMGNPFYPFVFGGLYWDAFRADWYSASGTGIGLNLKELFLLPINATLGHRDANFYDGRIGPLYLVLAPPTIYALLVSKKYSKQQKNTLFAVSLFFLLTIAAWIFGVVNSAALWQTRLLFPALIPFALPTALGLQAIHKLDISHLRISFIFKFIVIAVICINIINAGLFVIIRNPIAYAAGQETQEAYLEKVQPAYAQAIRLLEQTPKDAKIYFLFEPRSYYLSRNVQPDPILDSFAHNLFLYSGPDEVLQTWRSNGFSHILIYRRGVDFLIENNMEIFTSEHQAALEYLIQNHLDLVSTTEDGAYELYEIIQRNE